MESRVEAWTLWWKSGVRSLSGTKSHGCCSENGTCVILTHPEEDLAGQATEILRKWGPVHAGSPSADFSTITLSDCPGWVVTGHHPNMLTYVSPEEYGNREPTDLAVGLVGRSLRNWDAEDLKVIHVEDRRGAEHNS